LALIPFAGWIYGVVAAALGAWFLVEAHALDTRIRAVQAAESAIGAATPSASPYATEAAAESAIGAAAPSASSYATGAAAEAPASPAPMRLFHLSIAYLTLLFAAVAATALLPWGHW
jgi:heme O synthase-like polyprenyltransferase